MKVVHSILDAMGHTPLIRLSRFAESAGASLFGKCEFLNPGGSIKDRIAHRLVDAAEREGLLLPGGTIVEATGDNTGLGLAMVAAQRQYRLIAVMTDQVSADKVRLMRAVGAAIRMVSHSASPGSRHSLVEVARTIAAEVPGAWFAEQSAAPDNLETHFQTIGPEIWQQMDGRVDMIVTSVDTGAALSGLTEFAKTVSKDIRIVVAYPVGGLFARESAGSPSLASRRLLEQLGGDIARSNPHLELADQAVSVTDREAINATLELWRNEGLFVGGSSGCIAAAAKSLARSARWSGANIVAILPDGGRDYLATLHDPLWRAYNHFDNA